MSLEVRRFKGKLISKGYKNHSRKFLDQISEEDNIWICSGVLSRYLRKRYNISTKEYYNLVIYDDVNYHLKCKCQGCNNSRKFISLSRGYTQTCGNLGCLSRISSDKAKAQHSDPNSSLNLALTKLYDSSEFKEKMADNIRSFNEKSWKDEEYRKKMSEKSYTTINSWRSKSISKYKNFLSQGNLNDPCIFYLGLTDSNDIKFGVTAVNLDKGRCNRKWRLKLKSIHRTIKGTREFVAKIELELKLYLESNSEYVSFDNLSKIIKFIKQFV